MMVASERRSHRRAARVLSPRAARGAWIALCEAALSVAAAPEGEPHALPPLLKATPRGSFPLPDGDVRKAWAADLWVQLDRWRACGADSRRRFAGSLSLLASEVRGLLWDLGAAEAQAHRKSRGFDD